MGAFIRRHYKTALQFMTFLAITSLFLAVPAFAATSSLPIDTEIYEASNIPQPPDQEGTIIIQDLIFGALRYVKVIVAVFGILMISIMGFRLILNDGNEEEVTTAKRGLIYALIAFIIISMSQDIARLFEMGERTILDSPQEILNRVDLFDTQVGIFMTFLKYTIGAYATLMVVRSAISLITSGGNEEETSKHKKGILYSGAGLILIFVGEIFVEKVFYRVDKNVYSGITGNHPGVDAKEGVEQLVGITNFIVSFLAPIAILVLLGGAIMYATANGEEEQMDKAKRLITATIIGIVVIYGAFALVNTIISSRLVDIGVIAQ